MAATQLRAFSFSPLGGNLRALNTITAILEPNADGTLHLPLPPELRRGKVKVEATLRPVPEDSADAAPPVGKGFGAFRGKIWMAPDFDEPLDDFKEYMQ